jgi:hypothetical protein
VNPEDIPRIVGGTPHVQIEGELANRAFRKFRWLLHG